MGKKIKTQLKNKLVDFFVELINQKKNKYPTIKSNQMKLDFSLVKQQKKTIFKVSCVRFFLQTKQTNTPNKGSKIIIITLFFCQIKNTNIYLFLSFVLFFVVVTWLRIIYYLKLFLKFFSEYKRTKRITDKIL